jgi:thioredoxin:protein disulfide reductase
VIARSVAGLAVLALAGIVRAAGADEPLDPDDAFRLGVRLATGLPSQGGRPGLALDYRIAEGYYLYRDRFQVSIDPGSLALGAPHLPKGLTKDDPFVGKAEIFRNEVTLEIPFSGKPVPGTYTLKVVAQGCMEGRICYAPFAQEVRVNIPPGFQVTDAPGIRALPVPPATKP